MASTYNTPPAQNLYADTAATIRPWRDFLSLSSFSLPVSISELNSRLPSNLRHFRLNYALLSLLVLVLSLISRPLALILALLALAAWFFLYLSREEPLAVLDFQIDDRAVLVVLFFATALAVTLTHVWANVFVAALVSAGLVCLHAAIRFPADPDYEQSPYGALLSSGADDSPRGAYSHV
ncbi:hypothetical protein RHGRI_012190 [Rhododendron griersonianum]|uniref:PRA1 family protein n=1 Tax=Rhododendron griersonianum TaxID=479676 RepID=A0AAV6KQL2_9ERIC|nr:hypothetical protein RHGRI_012190 [Rhododendron griersonianum]